MNVIKDKSWYRSMFVTQRLAVHLVGVCCFTVRPVAGRRMFDDLDVICACKCNSTDQGHRDLRLMFIQILIKIQQVILYFCNIQTDRQWGKASPLDLPCLTQCIYVV
jgi:hypothetical protein